MSNPFNPVHRVYDAVRDVLNDLAQHIRNYFRQIWQRHLDFMNDREGYRAQVVAAVAALVAVTEMDPRLAAFLVAVLGLHAAAFGHQPPPPRYLGDEDRWDPFS